MVRRLAVLVDDFLDWSLQRQMSGGIQKVKIQQQTLIIQFICCLTDVRRETATRARTMLYTGRLVQGAREDTDKSYKGISKYLVVTTSVSTDRRTRTLNSPNILEALGEPLLELFGKKAQWSGL